METTKIENGIYKSKDATYYVKNEQVIMNLRGIGWFKTTTNFLQGNKIGELTVDMSRDFEQEFNKLNAW